MVNVQNSIWLQRPQMIEELQRLYVVGLSTADIARRLSKDFKVTVTKNAVCGRLNRMGVFKEVERDRYAYARQRREEQSKEKPVKPKSVKPKHAPFVWTTVHDEFALRMYRTKGASPSQIGHYMRRQFGYAPSSKTIYTRLSSLTVSENEPIHFDDVQVEGGGVTLEELKWCSCHWPVNGAGANTRFCGGELFHEFYCYAHTRRGHQTMPAKPKPAL